MGKTELIERLKSKEIKEILDSLAIQHLYLVGSYSRGEETEDSDIDLVYKRDKKARIGGIQFIKNKHLLEKKLNKKVDLVNNDYIYDDLKEYIDRDKILVY